MKARHIILLVTSIFSIALAIWATTDILFYNAAPNTIACKGILLKKDKVYLISNRTTLTADTINIPFPQASEIMPMTLAALTYNKLSHEWVLENLFAPPGTDTTAQAVLLPYCITPDNKRILRPGETVTQNTLMNDGIKWNMACGTKKDRVRLKLEKYEQKVLLQTFAEGININYSIKSSDTSVFGVWTSISNPFRNAPPAFRFLQTTTRREEDYQIRCYPNGFRCYYAVTSLSGKQIISGNKRHASFVLGDALFSIERKYTVAFCLGFVAYLLSITGFQVLLFYYSTKLQQSSPLTRVLIMIRIIVNNIVFIAVPLFLTVYFQDSGRWRYPLAVVLFNTTVFLPPIILSIQKREWIVRQYKNLFWFLLFAVALAPILLKFLAVNETVASIPVLHLTKLLIVALYLLLPRVIEELPWLIKKIKYPQTLQILLIALYASAVSVLTSDFGSLIYTLIAIVILQLTKQKFTRKILYIMAAALACYVVLAAVITHSPGLMKKRKYYRIVSPYINPGTETANSANEEDRETNAQLRLITKSNLEGKLPLFSHVAIPKENQSTFFSDYSFAFSFAIGGWAFTGLYLINLAFIIYELLFLIWFTKPVLIGTNRTFTFPSTPVAGAIRFLAALTLVSFIYPVCSNMMLIPVTGQSIPFLSISNWEVIVFMGLMICLKSIFGNEERIITNGSSSSYTYGDLLRERNRGFILTICILAAALITRSVFHFFSDSHFEWEKNEALIKKFSRHALPLPEEKDKLITAAVAALHGHPITYVPNEFKLELRYLAFRFHAGKISMQSESQNRNYQCDQQTLLSRMIFDSLISFPSRIISGSKHPYGIVYGQTQIVNSKTKYNVSNLYYSGYDIKLHKSINGDLHAECNEALKKHLNMIGVPRNIGCIMIIDNRSGCILTQSSSPLDANTPSYDQLYMIGSVKKPMLGWIALKIAPSYSDSIYEGTTFTDFISNSNDIYAASLLKSLLINSKSDFERLLDHDFGLSMVTRENSGYMDVSPSKRELNKKLDRLNSIYRLAIGQQNPYLFSQVIKWYARMASCQMITPGYNTEALPTVLHIDSAIYKMLTSKMNQVIQDGTAATVGKELRAAGVRTDEFIAKTGTAEAPNKQYNASSSFIIADKRYTIGIMLSGVIPNNNSGTHASAQHLFIKIIPILKKYNILHTQKSGRATKQR